MIQVLLTVGYHVASCAVGYFILGPLLVKWSRPRTCLDEGCTICTSREQH